MANLIVPGALFGIGSHDVVILDYKPQDDSVELSDSFAATLELSWGSTLSLADVVASGFLQVSLELEDSIGVSDEWVKVVRDTFVDVVGLSDTTEVGAAVEGLLDALGLSDSFDALATVTATFEDVIELLDALGIRESLSLSDTIALADAFVERVVVLLGLVDSLELSDSLSETNSLEIALADSVSLDDSFAEAIQRILSLSDTLGLVGRLRTSEEEEYVVWVVNPQTGGAYKWTQMPFNSVARIGNKTFFCQLNGLYSFDSDVDLDSSISPVIRTGMVNFADGHRELPGGGLKALANAFLLLSSEGETLLKVLVNRRGAYEEHWFKLRERTSGMTKKRLPVMNSLRSVLYQFELRPLHGKPAEFQEIELIPLYLQRRT